MADWEHKERNWNSFRYDDLDGDDMREKIPYSKPVPRKSFIEWLDWQCKDGWEVIKISRDFNSVEDKDTWCVFRRKS